MKPVQVDQSGKVEDTATDTVLAFSDDTSYAILIPSRVKRQCLLELRRRGQTGKSLYWLIFATGLFLLLKDHFKKLPLVIIDIEYEGQTARIKEHLINLLKRKDIPAVQNQVTFRRIGKKSLAHSIAYQVHRGTQSPDRRIKLGELLREFKEFKKNKKIGDPLRGNA